MQKFKNLICLVQSLLRGISVLDERLIHNYVILFTNLLKDKANYIKSIRVLVPYLTYFMTFVILIILKWTYCEVFVCSFVCFSSLLGHCLYRGTLKISHKNYCPY